MLYKANLKQSGRELTVHFDVNSSYKQSLCSRCTIEALSQAGAVSIVSIAQGRVDIESSSPIWSKVAIRLEKLFKMDLCADHLYELAEQRGILLE